jgi:hypothetical protein
MDRLQSRITLLIAVQIEEIVGRSDAVASITHKDVCSAGDIRISLHCY